MLGVYVPPKVFQDIVLRFTKGTSKEGYVKRTIKVIDYHYKVELFESSIHIHKVKREVVYSYYSSGTITIGSNTVSNTYLRPVVDENIPLMKVERKHIYKWELGTIVVKYYDYIRKWGNRVPGEWNPESRDYFWISCEASLASGSLYYPVPSAPTFSLVDGIAYIDEIFPIELSILSDLPDGDGVGAERTIHYTVDGSTPTDGSALYDESHVDIPAPSGDPGSMYTVKALVLHHVDSEVSTWYIYKMGDFLFATREYWTYDKPVITGEIDSGRYWPSIETGIEPQSEPNLVLSGIIDSGIYTTKIVSAPADLAEPTFQIPGGIINQGKWWNPIIEAEPAWD